MSNREEAISFYSSKLNSYVNIPRDKVCGYRITNPIMKKGYSDGVRAGRKNGIVDQSLSRYATEEERDSLESCEGNTNWLNHGKGMFKEGESLDNQFRINRPVKVVNIFSKNTSLPKNRRGGLGNWEISRNNFMASPIKPRFVSFDVMEVGEEPSEYKINAQIKVPDPTDFEWLREKARLEAEYTARFAGFPAGEIPAMVARELEINKPLGRTQRTTNKSSSNIANEQRLDTSQKLAEITQEVREGRVENEAGRRAITAQLLQIFTDTQGIAAVTRLQLRNLGGTLARLGIPTEYKKLGMIPRFVDVVFYNTNAGMINLLLFSKVRDELGRSFEYNYDLLVKDFARNRNGLPAMKLTSLVSALGRRGSGRRYLDLERGGVISRAQLREFARDDDAGGFDGPNFDIQPLNR